MSGPTKGSDPLPKGDIRIVETHAKGADPFVDPEPDLASLQRWMQSVIVHEGGVNEGIAASDAQAEVKIPAEQINRVINPSKSQTSLERLAIYSNAYKARLLEVLIGEYPALVYALGEEAFVGLAGSYLEAHPSHSYTLYDLGRTFPAYLAASRPANENEDGSPDWADFLVDLAHLERLYSEVFDGPGTEGQPTLQTEDLLKLSPGQWLTTRLITAPCLRLMEYRFPVHEYATAVRHEQEPPFPDPHVTRLAITRRDYIVRRLAMEEREFRVLSALANGQSVGDALQQVLTDHSVQMDQLANDVRNWFRNWAAAVYFVGLQ